MALPAAAVAGAGLALAVPAPGPLVATTVAAATAGAVLSVRGHGAWAFALLVAAVALGSWSFATARLDATAPPRLDLPAAARGTVVIGEEPEPAATGGERTRAASVELGPGVPPDTRLILDLPAGGPRLAVGDVVAVSGRLRRPAGPTAPGWWRAYLARERIAARLDTGPVRVVGRRGGLAGLRDRWRAWALGHAAAGLAGDRRALVRGMLLGGDAGLSARAADDFRAAGLWHLLAVSGQNVTVVAVAVLAGLRLLGVARRAATLGALGLVAAYCLACAPGPSVARAGLMGGVALAGELWGATRHRWHLLVVVLAVIVLHQPRALGDVGLQLSFFAVAGMFALAGPLAARLGGRMPDRVAGSAATALAAGLATAPVLAWHFGRISVVGLPLNVVAVPLAGPVVVTALASLAAAAVSGSLAALAAWPAGLGAAALLALARLGAAVPGAQADVPRGAAVALLGLAIAVAAACAGPSRSGAVRTAARGSLRAPAAAAAALAVAVLLPLPGGAGTPPPGPELRVLDVGQGDATLLRSPEGEALLVDAGPPGAPAPAAERLRRLGLGSLDAIAVTHPALDHSGGLDDVLGRVDVGRVLLPDPQAPVWAGTRAVAARHGVPVEALVAGGGLRIGAWEVRAVWPRPGAVASAGDPNDASLVLLASAAGVDAVLAGDAESPQLTAARVGPAEVLRVGHHGSEDSGLGALLARVRPGVALVSVGEGNRYGHPHPATLRALAAAGVPVMRTDRSGDLVLLVPAAPATAASDRRTPGSDRRPRGVRASRGGGGGAQAGLRDPRRGPGAGRAGAGRAGPARPRRGRDAARALRGGRDPGGRGGGGVRGALVRGAASGDRRRRRGVARRRRGAGRGVPGAAQPDHLSRADRRRAAAAGARPGRAVGGQGVRLRPVGQVAQGSQPARAREVAHGARGARGGPLRRGDHPGGDPAARGAGDGRPHGRPQERRQRDAAHPGGAQARGGGGW